MKKFKILKSTRFLALALLLPGWVLRGHTQSVDSLIASLPWAKADTFKVETLLEISKQLYSSTDPNAAITYAQQAKDLSLKLKYPRGVAFAYKYLGLVEFQQSKHVETMEYWNKSLAVFQSINDRAGIANIQGNIGVIYKDQGNDAKALEFFFKSLKGAEEAGDQLRYTIALNNIGSVYQHKSATYDKALEYYLKALPASNKLEDDALKGVITANLGEIYLDRGNSDSALFYFNRLKQIYHSTADIPYALCDIGKAYTLRKEYALALQYQEQAYDSAVAVNSERYQLDALQGMADIYTKTNQHQKALKVYLQAEALSNKLNSSYDLVKIYQGLSASYARLSNYNKAYKYQDLLIAIKDTIYNKESDLKLARYEFNFEIGQKEGQITLLEKDRALQAANIKREKFAKNAFIAGFGLILIIAFVLYRNYRIKVRTSRILDRQKNEIEDLLLNILPVEVAHELQTTGQSTPRQYDNVSVMFSDFKGFTIIADNMSPQELVEELNACFVVFDGIMEKYNLEKIKTIGDSYMCAGGIPTPDDEHPYRIIKASIEIQEYITDYNQQRIERGLEPWHMRIGIHIGPVVAGVVGKKKYAYDIWGSTVNIASRMESNGMPDKVNISAATYEQVKHRFACSYRGKIQAKNIGEIDMYFVDHEIVDDLNEQAKSIELVGERREQLNY